MFRKEKDIPSKKAKISQAKATAQIYILTFSGTREFLLDPNPRTFLPESERVPSDGVLGVIWRGWSWGADNKGVDLCRLDVGWISRRKAWKKAKIKPSQSVEIWRKPNDQMTKSTEGR